MKHKKLLLFVLQHSFIPKLSHLLTSTSPKTCVLLFLTRLVSTSSLHQWFFFLQPAPPRNPTPRVDGEGNECKSYGVNGNSRAFFRLLSTCRGNFKPEVETIHKLLNLIYRMPLFRDSTRLSTLLERQHYFAAKYVDGEKTIWSICEVFKIAPNFFRFLFSHLFNSVFVLML